MPGVLKKFKKGDVIIAEGTTGKFLYIIESGKVEVTKESPTGPLQLATLGPNEVFGEMSLIDDRFSRRTATVRAIEDSQVIVLDRRGFDSYINQASPGIFNLIKRLSKRLRETNDIITRAGGDVHNLPKALKTKPVTGDKEQKLTFDQMAESVEAAVDLNLMPKKFKKDQLLIRENADAMSLFLIRDGAVKIFKKLGDQEVEIDTLCASEVFGEISMFGDGKRFVTAKAIEDGEAVVFSKKQMDEMLRKAPLELFLIMECMTQKLKRITLRFLEQMDEKQKSESVCRKLEAELNDLKKENLTLQENLKKMRENQTARPAFTPVDPASPPQDNEIT
ncbi:MAG TPA: cyclic nucleotide-binding domain-containing protein [archaeon]|nr:cyclic nucleotide-binding domain-containing protein [archaeon]